MLRYADAIVKHGVDKLIEAIAHSAEPQTKNSETPQWKKRMRNDTDCAPQTTGHTTNCGLTEQAISLMDELYDISSNVKFRNLDDDQMTGLVSTTKKKAMVIDFLFDSKSVLGTKWLKNKSFALSLNKKLLPLHLVSG